MTSAQSLTSGFKPGSQEGSSTNLSGAIFGIHLLPNQLKEAFFKVYRISSGALAADRKPEFLTPRAPNIILAGLAVFAFSVPFLPSMAAIFLWSNYAET